jgi:hypothetical protein
MLIALQVTAVILAAITVISAPLLDASASTTMSATVSSAVAKLSSAQ